MQTHARFCWGKVWLLSRILKGGKPGGAVGVEAKGAAGGPTIEWSG